MNRRKLLASVACLPIAAKVDAAPATSPAISEAMVRSEELLLKEQWQQITTVMTRLIEVQERFLEKQRQTQVEKIEKMEMLLSETFFMEAAGMFLDSFLKEEFIQPFSGKPIPPARSTWDPHLQRWTLMLDLKDQSLFSDMIVAYQAMKKRHEPR